MIDNQNDKLMHAIENLEKGESWLVEPEFLDEKKYILKPCVKWGVKPGSYTFTTELFAPLMAVVRVNSLREAIRFVNSSEYGLTSGLQSLDENEIEYWKNNIEAGNLYINRGITGAIVNRQPFGGMKRSAFGGGIKAGGPNYVSCFVRFEEKEQFAGNVIDNPLIAQLSISPNSKSRIQYAFNSYNMAWKEEFSTEKPTDHIYGENNTFRYLPLKNCLLRVNKEDTIEDVILVSLASVLTRTPLTVSIDKKYENGETLEKTVSLLSGISCYHETEEEFISNIQNYERIRSCSPKLSEDIYKEAARLGIYIASEKPIINGRIELLHYLKEQSISYEYHRYGSIFEEDSSELTF